MAYVRRLPSGRWQGCAKSVSGLDTRVFDSKATAKAWADDRQALIAGGYDPAAAKTPLARVAEIWAGGLRAGNQQNTARALVKKLAVFPIGKIAIEKVTVAHVNTWLEQLSSGLAWSSIKRYWEELASCFKWAGAAGFWPANQPSPTRGAVMPPKPAPPDANGADPLTLENLQRIVAGVSAYNGLCGDVVAFLGLTGLRWGEARALQVGDIQLVNGNRLIHCRRSRPEGEDARVPKSGKPRWVPVAEQLWPVLWPYLEGKQPADLVFSGVKGGQLWRSRFLAQSHYNQISEGLTIHDLRHMAACVWLDSGIKLAVVSAWLGHSDVEITAKIYLKRRGRMIDEDSLGKLNALGGVA